MLRLPITLLLIFASLMSQSQNYFEKNKSNKSKKRLIVTHPTVSTLKLMHFLIEKKILDIKDMELIGIYYEGEVYDYEQSAQFLKDSKYSYMHLHEVKGILNDENVFAENELTPQFREIFENSIATMFFGGEDLQPSAYKSKTHLMTDIAEQNRHLFELSYLFHLIGGEQNRAFKPFLNQNLAYIVTGFCLGMQTMNVANGGTLIQDIPSEVYDFKYVEDVIASDADAQHKNYRYLLATDDDLSYGWLHRIKYVENGFITQQMKRPVSESPLVYSSHHQAVGKLANDYTPAAYSLDGKIIEAIQHKQFPNVYAYQFHPEKSALYNENEKIRFDTDDKVQTSYFEMLSKNGLEFHYVLWKYFSELLSK